MAKVFEDVSVATFSPPRTLSGCGPLRPDSVIHASESIEMIGQSVVMTDLFKQMQRIARHFRTVLITGATGTGKEMVARGLHQMASLEPGPLVICNCPAVVETLFESELFGHVKGAFTGAVGDKIGFFERANGGTIFLDEVGDIPLPMQPKLLRMLQNQEIQPVGSVRTRRTDVRIVAATNRNLRALVKRNQFREDLYYRLSAVELEIPALVDRRDDIPLLSRYFLDRAAVRFGRRIAGMTAAAQETILKYSWPGNVRELENAITHACIMAEDDIVDLPHLPKYLRTDTCGIHVGKETWEDTPLLPIAEIDRRHALRVYERLGRSKVRAAAVLGISRSKLYRLLGETASCLPLPKEE